MSKEKGVEFVSMLMLYVTWLVLITGRHGRASDADFDAELARAMQESLNLEYRAPRRSSDVASNAPPPRSD